MTLPKRTYPGLSDLGTLSQPSSGRIEVTNIVRDKNVVRADFKFVRARLSVTDATTNGSYGSYTFFQFGEQAISFLGSRQDYTSFVSDGTGVPNDTAFEIGIGTTAIAAAADGTLGNGTNENIGQAVSLTLSSGTAAGTAITNGAVVNGTATACKMALNVSGTAATVDGAGWLDVNGTATVSFMFIGDD